MRYEVARPVSDVRRYGNRPGPGTTLHLTGRSRMALRQEFVKPIDWMAIHHSVDDISEVCFWVQVVELRLENGVENRGTVAAGI